MQLTNETPFAASWTVGFQKDGREVVVVAVKATYRLRLANGVGPEIASEQDPLLESDEFGPDPANDAPIRENDFALAKPLCDVLVRARAYAPGGRPSRRVNVELRVGSCHKSFAVVGPRSWVRLAGEVTASEPVPFDAQDISYDTAFGGTDTDPDNPSKVHTYVQNPVGIGYCPSKKNLDRLAPPLTEEVGRPVTSPAERHRPMALGPIGRNWDPRYKFAGTYDEKWQTERVPFLPDDFDYRYFQAAAADQVIPHPHGGEVVALVNLCKEGQLVSRVPTEGVQFSFFRKAGSVDSFRGKLDTLVIDPDADRMYLTWRASCPMIRDPFELREMLVSLASKHSPGRLRAGATGKTYHENLDQLARANGKARKR